MPICDVVICAHNEDRTVGAVLRAVCSAKLTNRVVLVADRCSDKTEQIGYAYHADVRTAEGGTKGSAMAVGLGGVATENVLFLDADIRGLTPSHVDLMCLVTTPGQVVGTRDAPIRFLERWLRFPSITGDRRVPTWIAHKAELYDSGWKAETKINLTCERYGLPTTYVALRGVVNRSKVIQDPVGWGFELGQVAGYMGAHSPELVRGMVRGRKA